MIHLGVNLIQLLGFFSIFKSVQGISTTATDGPSIEYERRPARIYRIHANTSNTTPAQYWDPIQNIAVTYNGSSGWYANLAFGKSGIRGTSDFKLKVDTAGNLTFVSSTIQVWYDANIDNNRSRIRPLFDALNTTLYHSQPPTVISPLSLAYPLEDQKFFGTNDTAYVPIYRVGFYISTDVWAMTNRNGTSSNLASSYFVGLLSYQYPKDRLDGRLGLGDIRPAVTRTSLRASEEIDATGAAHSLCLPFATYFPPSLIRGPSPLLQCFIDGEKGDTTKYRPVDKNTNLLWLDCSVWEKWSLRPLSIVISGKTYPLSQQGLLKMGLNESYSLFDPQVRYQDVVVLDSATAWTRLHPWIVSKIYGRIPNSEYYHYTYFIPCSVTLKDIPNISFNFNSTLGKVIELNASKVDFAVDTYRHPEKDELCAGTIQQIIETSVTDGTTGELVSQGDAMGSFGHWIFKSWYMVFKVVEDSDGRRRRQIGLAHYL